MAGSNKPSGSSGQNPTERPRVVYSEFGPSANDDALERAVPDLPPNQQNLRVQASRAGRKGKTVTVITGFQARPKLRSGQTSMRLITLIRAGRAFPTVSRWAIRSSIS